MSVDLTSQNQSAVLGRILALGFTEANIPEERENPYTGVTHTLCPRACLLYDFITTSDKVCGKDYTRQDRDTARMWFRLNWPREYMDLID